LKKKTYYISKEKTTQKSISKKKGSNNNICSTFGTGLLPEDFLGDDLLQDERHPLERCGATSAGQFNFFGKKITSVTSKGA
jgi:hypothetical protein